MIIKPLFIVVNENGEVVEHTGRINAYYTEEEAQGMINACMKKSKRLDLPNWCVQRMVAG